MPKMARVRGQNDPHFRNPRPWFAYSKYNLYVATMTIKGTAHGKILGLPLAIFGRKFLSPF